MARTGIFISSLAWDGYQTNGFRTRRGAILKALIHCGEFEHLLLLVETGLRGAGGIRSIGETGNGIRITEVSVPGRFPERLMRLLGHAQLISNYMLPPEFVSALQEQHPILIWSYSAGLGKLIQQQISAPLLYDVIDFKYTHVNQTMMGNYFWWQELLAGCRYADAVVCNGEIAFKELQKFAKRCVIIRNGIDPEHLIYRPAKTKRHAVAFVGIISNWIDFDLLELILESLPDVNFEFYGIVLRRGTSIEKLQRHANFHWHGEIAPQDVVRFVAGCQVALVPYDPRMTRASLGDSMKIFEYLAAGTPVVTTDFQLHLTEKFDGLIEICRTRSEFIATVKRLVEMPSDPVWQEKAWQFVKANSWQHRVDEIVKLAAEIQ